MAHIEIAEIGRNAEPPIRYPVLSGRDPQLVLAEEIDAYWNEGALVSPVYGNPNAFVIMRTTGYPLHPVVRIALVDLDVSSDDEQTQKITVKAS